MNNTSKHEARHTGRVPRNWVCPGRVRRGFRLPAVDQERRNGIALGRALLLPACLLIFFTAAAPGASQTFEVPANRSAAQILPANLIAGPHYRVRDKVVSYGYMHHFTVDSDFGVFEVTGNGALRKLLREIRAIAGLKKVEQSKAYLKAVGYAAKAPVRLAKSLITDPVDTITGIPEGIFTIFGNVGRSITMKHDPSEDSKLKQILFVSSWKRDYAYKYGVDVYSSNKVLQKQLNKVGWAAAVGGLTVSVATAAAGGAAAVAAYKNIRLADSLISVLKAEPPPRVRIICEKKFAAMGIPDDVAKKYLDHPHFTPRHDLVIAESLSQLKGARGRDVFLNAILAARDEVSANFFMNTAETMRGYHETVSPITEITVVGGFTFAKTQKGSALMPFPLDHGVWSAKASQVIDYLKTSYKSPGFNGVIELWVAGTVSPLARQQLAIRGFTVVENVDRRVGFMD